LLTFISSRNFVGFVTMSKVFLFKILSLHFATNTT
jgi:hypothetical protein